MYHILLLSYTVIIIYCRYPIETAVAVMTIALSYTMVWLVSEHEMK